MKYYLQHPRRNYTMEFRDRPGDPGMMTIWAVPDGDPAPTAPWAIVNIIHKNKARVMWKTYRELGWEPATPVEKT